MRQRMSRVYAGDGSEGQGRTFLGIRVADIVFWTVASVVVFAVTLLWDLVLADIVDDQNLNKYLLTAIIIGLAVAFTVLSLIVSGGGAAAQSRKHRRAQIAARLGIALQLFGTIITPLGVYHAAFPPRSVPIGFAFFTAVFAGIFLAGFAGNVLAPERA